MLSGACSSYTINTNNKTNYILSTEITPKETCANIPDGSNVLFLPGTYTKRIKIIGGDTVTFELMLCFVGAISKNIYGCGNLTIIRSIASSGPRDCPIYSTIESNRKDLSQLSMSPYYSYDTYPGIWWRGGTVNIRNMKMIYNSGGRSSHAASLSRWLDTGTILKNINFEITGNYSLHYHNGGTTIYYQNCTFTGGNRQGNYSGASIITTAPDNEIDTLIKNTNFNTGNKIITFHPHKQRYKPSYTLIPLASSGYYDISQNDLVDLETEAKKNINLPVLNDTRAMSNLSNFKITL